MKYYNIDKMSTAELDRLYAEAEKMTLENTRPLTAADRRALASASRKAGRPRIGGGALKITITVERGLLKKADAYARNHGLTRAAAIAQGLKKLLAA